jgi:hypothetical protein
MPLFVRFPLAVLRLKEPKYGIVYWHHVVLSVFTSVSVEYAPFILSKGDTTILRNVGDNLPDYTVS